MPSTSPIGSSAAAIIIFIFSPPFVFILLTHGVKNPINYCQRSIRDDKKKLEQAKKRLADLDVIIARLYEDYVLGNLNQDRYRKMSADYEAEQERLKLEIEVIEEWVEQREEMNDGLDAFIALTQKYVDVEELTQTIVNEYIKKIIVYAPDKSSGKRKQKVKIFFNFVDDVDIPVISEPIITQTTYEHRKTA